MSDLVLLEGGDPEMREKAEWSAGVRIPWAASGQEKKATVWFCPGRPPAAPRELPALRWIHSGWAGIEDWFQRPEWRDGVDLTRTVGDFPQRIAEYVVGWLLAQSLDVPEALRQMETRAWQRWTSRTLFGRALLVVGYGAIGRRVAEAARGLGMHALGIRRGPVTQEERSLGIQSVESLNSLLMSSSVVVNLLPLTKETVGFWNADRFRWMMPGSTFVNVSRGGTVDEAALIAGLAKGQPARAILDVFQEEPLPATHPLRSTQGVWITPHVAGIGTKEPLAAEFAANWHRYRDGVPLRNVVDRARGY